MRNTGQIEFGDPPTPMGFWYPRPNQQSNPTKAWLPTSPKGSHVVREGLPPSNHYFCIVPALFLESSGWWNPCLQESHPLFYGEVTDPEVKRAKAMVKLLLYLGIPYYYFLKFSCFFPEVTLSQGKPPPLRDFWYMPISGAVCPVPCLT